MLVDSWTNGIVAQGGGRGSGLSLDAIEHELTA